MGRRRRARLPIQLPQVRTLDGRPVPVLPRLTIDLPGGPDRPSGVAALPDAEIVRGIEEWRRVWPEIAAIPSIKARWDAIHAEAVACLKAEEGRG